MIGVIALRCPQCLRHALPGRFPRARMVKHGGGTRRKRNLGERSSDAGSAGGEQWSRVLAGWRE